MLLSSDDDKALLTCRPTPAVLEVAAQLEGRRRWLKAGGLQFEASPRNLELVRDRLAPAEDRQGQALEAHSAFDLGRRSFRMKTHALPHQERAKAAVGSRDSFALFSDQGTGKTWVAIQRAGELWVAGKIDAVLVVSKKGVHEQWIESQIPKHIGIEEWDAAYWPFKEVPEILLKRDDRMKWFAINFDGAKSSRGRLAVREFIRAHRGRIFIIGDETQEIKNARSERHKAMMEFKKLAECDYRLALTGTPIAKDLTDEWSQLLWLDESILGIRYITTFRAEFCRMGGYENREVVGYKNLEAFKEKTAPAIFRMTKEELGLLPPSFDDWVFDLLPAQRKMIRSVRDDLLAQISDGTIVSVANAAVAMSKIQQIANGFIMDEDGIARNVVPIEDNPRLNAMIDYVDATPGKIIIWAKFRHDIGLIESVLGGRGKVVQYHGGTSERERRAAVDSFLSPNGARIFLSNPQSGGTGLNLQGLCRNALYYSNGYNAIDRWQSQDRIHRIGTTGQVIYTDLIAKGSTDRAIIANLKRKKNVSDMAIGDLRNVLESL